MSSTSYSNPDFVEEAHEQARQKQREERLEAVENLSTKKWLETKLEEQAQPYPIMGREFLFTPVGNERVEELLEMASQEAANLEDRDVEDLDDLDPNDLDDDSAFVREMRQTLEEHCLDDYMAEEGLKKLPLDVLQRVFEDVAMGEGVSDPQAERARKFRE